MIKFENVDIYGWEAAIRGMRNPMNSWTKSDSYTSVLTDEFMMGKRDFKLASQLIKAGTDHSKFMRMITVTCDILAPLYWWKEYDTYKVGTVANSCSTMHKIHEKEFTFDDFSCEHLFNRDNEGMRPAYYSSKDYITSPYSALHLIINILNTCREYYIKTNDKSWWWQMIQLLPTSYNQRRTVQLNYATLRNIYHSRKNHKLDEWRDFCEWIENLPYSELITGEFDNV